MDKLDISKIKPYPKNAKKHPEKQIRLIAESIKRFGWQQPIKVGNNGIIIAGHGRWEAWMENKGKMKAPWIINEAGETISGEPEKRILTNAEERAYRLADNKIAESDWDMGLVGEELKELDDDLVDLTGFDRNMFAMSEDDFDAEAEYAKIRTPITQSGDIYEIGKHKLMCGDSTDSETYEKLMQDEKAQLVFTDPPYNVNYKSAAGNSYSSGKYGGGNKMFNDNQSDQEFTQFITNVSKNCFEFSDDQCLLYMWFATKNELLFRKGIDDAGWKYHQTVIWVKEKFVFGMGVNYHRAYEPCIIAIKNGKYRRNKYFANISDIWELEKVEFQDMMDVWYLRRDDINKYVHPTQKPVRLAERAFRRNTSDGDIVLDAFGGSGSTLIGCEQMSRKGRLIELDPKYCDVIVERYVKFIGNSNILKNGRKIEWRRSSK